MRIWFNYGKPETPFLLMFKTRFSKQVGIVVKFLPSTQGGLTAAVTPDSLCQCVG